MTVKRTMIPHASLDFVLYAHKGKRYTKGTQTLMLALYSIQFYLMI